MAHFLVKSNPPTPSTVELVQLCRSKVDNTAINIFVTIVRYVPNVETIITIKV